MAIVTNQRKNFATWIAFAVAAVVAVACNIGGSGGEGSPTSTGSGGIGTASPTKSVVVVSPYPNTAKAYAEAILAAWKAHNLSKLGDLTTPQVQEQIIEIPGPPNQSWTYMMCDGAAGSSYCSFYNATGDEIVLRISNLLLGQAHAGTEVMFDSISFPDEGVAYVKEFVAAWQKGNKARMNALAVADVVTYANSHTPPVGPTYPEPTCCGGGLLQVVVQWDSKHVTFDVGTTLLGGKDAIVGHTP